MGEYCIRVRWCEGEMLNVMPMCIYIYVCTRGCLFVGAYVCMCMCVQVCIYVRACGRSILYVRR